MDIQKLTAPLPITHYAAAAASGILLAGAFPPLDLGWLAWVALVPLFWSIRSAPPGTAFRLGYLTGVVWFGLLLFWITLFGLLTWAALVVFLALYLGGFAALLRWLSQEHPRWDLLLIPMVWTAVEVVRSTGPIGFPWGLLGVSQHRLLPVLQLASLGGVHFLTLMLVLVNTLLVTLLPGQRQRTPPRLRAGVVVLLSASIAFGLWRMQMPLSPAIRAAVLQPNVPPLQKGAPETYEAQLRLMRQLTQEARGQGADLIVFPETAIPLNLLGAGGLAREVGSWAPDRVVVASSLEAGSKGGIRNSVVVIRGSRVLGVYVKRRLVPFGEAGITPGSPGAPIVTPVGRLGVAISYESAFPEIGRVAVRQGADVLVVVTNDGWFGNTAGPHQHAADAPVRAVETGRSLVRAADTGISLIVDPLGRVQGLVPLNAQGVLVRAIYAPVPTVYVRGGWLLVPGVIGGVVLLALRLALRGLRGSRHDPAFKRLVLVLGGPGIVAATAPAVMTAMPSGGRWLAPAALLAASIASAGTWKALAIRPRRAPASGLLGLGVVVVLGLTMLTTYARYGIILQPVVPQGGWLVGGLAVWLNALAWEVWLRGIVFQAARAWRGNAAALILSTAPVLATVHRRSCSGPCSLGRSSGSSAS